MAQKYIITISREFASMGRSIAKQLARDLGINFYDRDIVEQTSRRMCLPVSEIASTEEAAHNIYYRRIYPLGMGVWSLQDEIFQVQRNIIRDLASRESCIIVGRCASEVLKDFERTLNVHVFAPVDDRLRNCVEKLEMDPDVARRTLMQVDRSRKGYHKRYGGGSEFANCHMMVNSSEFGIDGSARLIAAVARMKFDL